MADLKVIGQYILTLMSGQLCAAFTYQYLIKNIWKCITLSVEIPKKMATDYNYFIVAPYFHKDGLIKLLLLSKTTLNLHLDMALDASSNSTGLQFTILNTYAGY